jgi:hypothetical protein
MTKKQRLYTVQEIETGAERQYLTDSRNRLLHFPFKGCLWTAGKEGHEYTQEQISPGEMVTVNYSCDTFHPPKYPPCARVLKLDKGEQNQRIYRNPEIRLYLLSGGKDPFRRVMAANSQNIIYNCLELLIGLVPEALVREGTGFSSELFEPKEKIAVRPIFSGKVYGESFVIEDSRIIFYKEYIEAVKRNEKAKDEAAKARFKASLSYGRAIKKAETNEERERLERRKEATLSRIGDAEILEEMLERIFFWGDK